MNDDMVKENHDAKKDGAIVFAISADRTMAAALNDLLKSYGYIP